MPSHTAGDASRLQRDPIWIRWRKLPAREKCETLVAVGLIPLAAASLRIFGGARTLKAMTARRHNQPVTTDAVIVAARAAANAVSRASRRGVWAGNCFSRSLALQWLLRRRGIEGDLRFGARTTSGRLEAHAWIEVNGVVINDRADVHEQFAPLKADARAITEAAREPAPAPRRDADMNEVLLACLHQDAGRSSALLHHLDDRQWAELIDLASRQRVRPLLYRRLTAADARAHVPAAALQELAAASRQVTLRNLQAVGELSAILRAFEAAGIPAVVLKGAYLAPQIYGNAGLREMIDLDVMVHRRDIEHAYALVVGRGYRPSGTASLAAIDKTKHAPTLVKPGHLGVELHWTLTMPDRPHAIDPKELWTRTAVFQVGGTSARTLAVEDHLLYLCHHASHQHQFEVGLRPFCDVTALIRHSGAHIDWAAVQERAVRWGWTRGVFLTLCLARDLLGAGVPADVLAKMRTADFDDAILSVAHAEILRADAPGITLRHNVARLVSEEDWTAKLRHVRRRLFLDSEEMAREYAALPAYRRILTRALRPVTLLWRHGTTVARLLFARAPALTQDAVRKNALRRWLEGGAEPEPR